MNLNGKKVTHSGESEGRSVLIFGGAGFVGSNWAAHLLQQTSARVHVFDNLSRAGVQHNLKWLRQLARNSGRLQVTVGDIRDSASAERAVAPATEIYQFAAQVAVTTSLEDPRHDFEVNLAGTFNVLDAVRRAGHRPFLLFTSTNKVYGDLRGHASNFHALNGVTEEQPLDFHSPYGCSKGAADQYVRDFARVYGIPAVVFRMSCIAGPRQFGTEDQGWVAHFLYSALQARPITIYGDGRQLRDVLYIDDLLRAFEAARANLAAMAGEIYNVGGGAANTTSLLELIKEVEALTGLRVDYSFAPRRSGDQIAYVTNYNKLRRQTGWAPEVNLHDILSSMRRWWNAHQELFVEQVGPSNADAFQPMLRTA